jgi:hypothetical protein
MYPNAPLCTCPEITYYFCNQFTPDLPIKVQSYYWTSTMDHVAIDAHDNSIATDAEGKAPNYSFP